MPRRITRAKVKFISLCERGANRLPVIYKSDDGSFDLDTILKADDNFADNGLLTSVVYSPEMRDSQGDIASAEVIQDAAYDFAKNGLGAIDIRHDGKALPKDSAAVVESFLIRKGDDRFAGMKNYAGEPVDVTNGWGVVIKIEDPALRKLYKDGKWNGISMGGHAQVKDDTEASLLTKFLEAIGLHKNKPSTGDDDMKPEEMQSAIEKANKPLTDAVTALITKLGGTTGDDKDKKDKKGDEGAPVFKGEFTATNIKKHSIAVRRHAIISKIDWTDTAAVTKSQTELAALETEEAEIVKAETEAKEKGKKDEKKTPEQQEIEKLEGQIADLRKRSNQGSGGEEGAGTGNLVGFSKEDQDAFALGKSMAKMAPGQKPVTK